MEEIAIKLDELQENSSTIFSKNIPSILRILANDNQHDFESILSIYSVIINDVMDFPEKYKKEGKTEVESICAGLCNSMTKIIEKSQTPFLKINREFNYKSFETFEKDFPEEGLLLSFLQEFARVLEAMGESFYEKFLESSISILYGNDNPYLQSAVILCLCQFIKLVEIGMFKNVITVIETALKCPNEMIRYYAVCTLTHLICNLGKSLEKESEKLKEIIIIGIEKDTDTICHEWITSFKHLASEYHNNIANGDREVFMPFVYSIANKIHLMASKLNPHTTIQCIFNIQDLAELTHTQSHEIIKKYFDILKFILSSFRSCKEMLEKSCECMCLILSKCSLHMISTSGIISENYAKLYNKFISYIEVNKEILEEQNEEVYIIINDVIEYYHININTYLERTFIIIFQSLEKHLANSNTHNNQNNHNNSTNSSHNNSHDNSHNNNSHNSSNSHDPKVEKIELTCTILEKLIPLLKRSNNKKVEYYILNISKFILFNVIEKENNIKIKYILLNLFNTIIKSFCYIISSEELTSIFTSIEKFQNLLHAQKMENFSLLNNNYSLNPNKINKSFSFPLLTIHRCLMIIPDITQNLLKYLHNQNHILENELAKVTIAISKTNGTDNIWELLDIANIICCFMENFTFENLQNYWLEFYKFTTNNIYKNNLELRNILIYTIGIMAEKIPSDIFTKEQINELVNIIKTCLSLPKEKCEKQTTFLFCLDNFNITLGKIIYKFEQVYSFHELHGLWLNSLPLKEDKNENLLQIKILHKLITTPAKFISELNINNLTSILKLSSRVKIFMNEEPKTPSNIEILSLIKTVTKELSKHHLFISKYYEILQSLSSCEKYDLNIITS